MFNLIVRDLKNYREEFPINSQVVIVGRDENAHIQIDSGKISRKQFRIISKGLKLYIEDLNSSNGTFLNEEKIEKITVISENDVIQFGNLYAQLNNTNKIKKDFKIDDIVDTLIDEMSRKSEKPYYRLVSEDKRYPGLSFDIEEGLVTLGRTSISNIIVPDKTLSKKHLQFDRRGKKLFIEDLKSINGCKLNGRKLRSSKQVFARDKVEIGDVQFTIQSNITLEKNDTGSKKKLVIASITVLSLLLLAVALKPKKKPPVKKKVEMSVDDKIDNSERKMDQYLAKAQKFSLRADWDSAILYCQKVLDEDPANLNAKKYKSRFIHEKKNSEIYARGKEAFELLSFEDAIKHLSEIPKNTFYREKAKLHIRESKEKLKKSYFADSKVYYRSRRYRDAYASLEKLFKIASYHPKARELKLEIEKDMKRRRIKYKKFSIKLNPVANSKSMINIEEKIKSVYPEKEIATPVEYYVRGNIEYAIKYLNKISVTNKHYKKTRVILKSLLFIKTKYQQGNSFILKKDYPKARTELDQVIKADKELLQGTNLVSKQVQTVKHHLSEGFYKRGKKALKDKRHKVAYIELKASLKYDPQNTYTLSELTRMKSLSETFWNKSLVLEKNGDKLCFRYWRAIIDMNDKDSNLYKKAMSKLNNAAQ